MKKARLRVMAGLAGATLCLFAVTTYAQNTNTTTGTTPDQSAQTAAPTTTQPGTSTGNATTPTTPPADAGTTNGTITSTATDVTTTDTTTRSFPGGFWGIVAVAVAVAVVVLLVLFSLFRGKDRTVVKDTYVTTDTAPNTRSTGMGTASSDRVVTQRVASGTERTTKINDPNARS
jgi:hypothetical protein